MDRMLTDRVPRRTFVTLLLLVKAFVFLISAVISVSWTSVAVQHDQDPAEFHEGLWDTCVCADFTKTDSFELRGGELNKKVND